MAACTIHAWVQMRAIDVISADILLWSLYFLWFKNVHEHFVYVGAKVADHGGNNPIETSDTKVTPRSRQDDAVAEERYPRTLPERLRWIGILLISIRMNNWRIGEASHDRRQPPRPAFESRWPFFRQAVLSFVRGYIVLDLTRAYIGSDLYFTDPTVSVSSPLPFPALYLIPPRLFRSAIIGAQAWAAISQFTYLPCLLPLALNAVGSLSDEWSPHTWAPTFGSSIAVANSGIRGFWGEYWHAFMRVMTTAPGYALADRFATKHGSMMRYAMIITSGFAFSGIVHMGLVPPYPLYAAESIGMIRLKVASFFWLQPPAIFVEILIDGWLRANLWPSFWKTKWGTLSRKVSNVVLFTAWSSLCLPLLGDMGRQIGYWRVWPVPISLWQWLTGQGLQVW